MEQSAILIVEDERLVARDLERRLRRLGYNVIGPVASGEEALELVETTQPALVLMDITLQGLLDGVETAQQMRSRYHLPVVFLTAHSDAVTVQRAKSVSPFGYIIKPFDERELAITLEMAIYRSRAEQALRESEKRYETLAEISPVGIYRTDTTGAPVYVNRRLWEITGIPVAPLETVEWRNALHPEDLDRVLQEWATAVREQRGLRSEYRLLRPDGDIIWVVAEGVPEHDDQGRLVGWISTLTDVTEQKRQESALREMEELYRRAIEAAGAVPYRRNYATESYSFIGEGIADMTGYTPEELTPQLMDEIEQESFLRDHLAGMSHEEAIRRVRTGEFSWKCEIRIRTRSGQTRWLSDVSIELADASGHITGSIGILEDITERKQTEEAMERLNKELEQRVSERTAQLQAANASLRQTDEILRQRSAELSMANVELAKAARMKDEFLANMSHELRTPLIGILSLAEVLQEQIYGELTDTQLRYLRSIEESGRHLLSLINDILDLSKIGAGRLEIHLELCSVEQVCQASLRMVRQMAQDKRQELLFSLCPGDVQLTVDPLRCKQMLVNLLSNAVKFTPYGGCCGLSVEANAVEQRVEFTVWDKGIGIAQEDFDKLFQPFTQVDSRLARQYAGTGLGLSLVRRMAELHGGGVVVESEPGRGSRFTVMLPWREAAIQTAPPANVPPAVAATSTAPILLIDDNEPTITAVHSDLTARGYTVEVERNGSNAVSYARRIDPALILIDVQMAGMDGLQTIRLLRARPDGRAMRVPIIALTALAVPGDRERYLAAGADDYLNKPLCLSRLAELIHGYVQQRQIEQNQIQPA
jgi:PAS domain S-box-containing protein